MNDLQQMKQDIIAGNDIELKNAMIMADSAMETQNSMQEIETLYATHIDGAQEAVKDSDTFIKKFRKAIDNLRSHSASELLLNRSRDMKDNNDIVKVYFDLHVKNANTEHSNFKLLNEKNVPQDVLQAVALHYLATAYEQNEKAGQVEKIAPVAFKVPDFRPYETDYINNFKEKANEVLNDTAQIFANKGHKRLAQLCKDAIVPVEESTPKLTLQKFAEIATWSHRSITREINAVLDPMGDREPPYTSDNEEWLSTINRCASLAEGNNSNDSKKPELAL